MINGFLPPTDERIATALERIAKAQERQADVLEAFVEPLPASGPPLKYIHLVDALRQIRDMMRARLL